MRQVAIKQGLLTMTALMAILRFLAPVDSVVGGGQYVEGLTLDIDGRLRAVDAVDIGAAQY